MRTHLDCIPCFVRQALDAAREVSADPGVHERVLREMLGWAAAADLGQPPPVMGQRLHRRLREVIGVRDPYKTAKDRQNRMALKLLAELRSQIVSAPDPLDAAVRLAIAGNIIDMGAGGRVTEPGVREALKRAMSESLSGGIEEFRQAIARARTILYLADNAGEIVFDRVLIEQLPAGRVTLAVRGAPVLNDATMDDARAAGLDLIVEVIDNGSDAPGTVLADCDPGFVRRFAEADVILAKGQGNYETLGEERRDIFFLFKVKCPVIAEDSGRPFGAHVLARTPLRKD